MDLLCKIHSVVDVLHPQPRWRLFGTGIGGVKYLPPQLWDMVQSDTDADMVELDIGTDDPITVPADALEDAVNSLPDNPVDEVAMVTDSVVVSGDGNSDRFVRVMRPVQFNNEGASWFGTLSHLCDKIEDARPPALHRINSVSENIVSDGEEVGIGDLDENTVEYPVFKDVVLAMKNLAHSNAVTPDQLQLNDGGDYIEFVRIRDNGNVEIRVHIGSKRRATSIGTWYDGDDGLLDFFAQVE